MKIEEVKEKYPGAFVQYMLESFVLDILNSKPKGKRKAKYAVPTNSRNRFRAIVNTINNNLERLLSKIDDHTFVDEKSQPRVTAKLINGCNGTGASGSIPDGSYCKQSFHIFFILLILINNECPT